MPRWKNPKPQQLSDSLPEESDVFSLAEMGDAKSSVLEPPFSVSSPSTEKCETEEIQTEEERQTLEMREYSHGSENNDSRSVNLEPEKTVCEITLSSIDPVLDKPQVNNEGEHSLGIRATKNKTRRPSFGLLSPNILSWLKRRFTLRENAKTSASQVIRLYEKEFQEDVNVPLQSYQVGQLLRRIFPNIQRCKITVNGKRVWVYKHLCIADVDASNAKPSLEMSNSESGKSAFQPIRSNKEHDAELKATEFNRQISSSVAKTLGESTAVHNSERRLVKNSAILYNLLYPRHGSDAKKSLVAVDEGGLNGSKSFSADVEPDANQIVKRNANREGNVVNWLRDNYEYADGYYVKSMDVLRKYNQGRETMIKYLSQVGRVIKFVFPRARHLRRSLKGGKREWVYHNIRPKDYTDKDIWRGSVKNLARDEAFSNNLDGRPSMLAFPSLSVEKCSKFERVPPEAFSRRELKDEQPRRKILLENFDSEAPNRSDKFYPDDGISINARSSLPDCHENSMALTSSSTREHHGVFHDVEKRHEARDSKNGIEIPWWFPMEQSHDWEKANMNFSKRPAKSFTERGLRRTNIGNRRSHLELQIDRLKTEKCDVIAESICQHSESASNHSENSFPERICSTEQAEDLSMQTAESSALPSTCDYVESTESNIITDVDMLENDNTDNQNPSEAEQIANSTSNEPFVRHPSTDHNYSYCNSNDDDSGVRDLSNPDNYKNTNERLLSNPGLAKRMPRFSPFQQPTVAPVAPPAASKQIPPLQWEDLSMCGAHRYGWTLTPTMNNEIPSNFIEWVLFEGQLLRDGQRVYRELKIYDDWSVSIHAMGRKVYPDELGGITDLTRSRESVAKVFATLSSARSCRGLPALCLSDLCVHGVVVAKSEIWSSREDDCEELRHRAINCQVLYRGNEEACPKCTRVIRMHSLNSASSSGHNGFAEKGANRFTARCGSSY